MQIDWITLGAQVLNFVILVLLLRHFLYGRITGVIDGREEEIASRRREAEEKLERAEEEARRHREAMEELEERRQQMLREAREEAEEERERHLEEARAEVAHAREAWRRGLRREKQSLLRDLRRSAGSATYAAVSRALEDLADEDLEARVVDRFVARLRDRAEEEGLQKALSKAKRLTVRTAFGLAEDQRARIASTLADLFGRDGRPDFERDPELILGLRLQAGDHVVGWSGRDYVRELEERVGTVLDREKTTGPEDEEGERARQEPTDGEDDSTNEPAPAHEEDRG